MAKTPLEMISDGLAARQGRSQFGSATAVKTSAQAVQSLREDFDAAHKRHASALRTIEKAMADFDAAALIRIKEYRTLRPAKNNNGDDGAIRQRRSMQEIASFGRDIKSERQTFLRKLFSTLSGELAEARALMGQAAHSASVSRELFSPQRLASAFELGGDRRGRLMLECRDLPPAALQGLAQRAAADSDRELAGILVAINDSRQPSQRSFNSVELASVPGLFGDKSKFAIEHANYVETTNTAANLARRNLETGKSDGFSRIEAALNAKD